ncbi:MAG: rod shape-determining protein MreC, partial [Patescibacteria group bacterium]|nr:rod shape-determining protein MreC [Patescibacteria group bacterium]
MTYLLPRKKKVHPSIRILLVAAGIIVAAVAVLRLTRPSLMPALFMTVARPFWRVEFAIKLGSLDTPEGLLQENADLKRELESAKVRLETISGVEAENEALRSLMNRASTTPYTLAAVLERPPLSLYDQYLIDLGSAEGVAAGDAVYAAGNVPIGRVTDVFAHTARVILFTSPGQSYQVLIGHDLVPATANGRGGGASEAELPQSVHVASGDPVMSPAVGSGTFGTVTAVISD